MTYSTQMYAQTCPLSQQQLLDDSFMEHRAQVLALAAFLDRFERAAQTNAEDDFRMVAFREALKLLLAPGPERARQIQMVLSDQDVSLLSVRDSQSAFGASGRDAQDSKHQEAEQ
ncbi:hypothetical protein [Deinococcus sp.]|uniref:hypothetical protein n=1 Tax=Deinococcus sp. TaxID=47478 RepID=UPI003B5AFD01